MYVGSLGPLESVCDAMRCDARRRWEERWNWRGNFTLGPKRWKEIRSNDERTVAKSAVRVS